MWRILWPSQANALPMIIQLFLNLSISVGFQRFWRRASKGWALREDFAALPRRLLINDPFLRKLSCGSIILLLKSLLLNIGIIESRTALVHVFSLLIVKNVHDAVKCRTHSRPRWRGILTILLVRDCLLSVVFVIVCIWFFSKVIQILILPLVLLILTIPTAIINHN